MHFKSSIQWTQKEFLELKHGRRKNSVECVEDKIEKTSQQVEQKDKEVESRREKLRILEHQSSSSNIPKIEIPKREKKGFLSWGEKKKSKSDWSPVTQETDMIRPVKASMPADTMLCF